MGGHIHPHDLSLCRRRGGRQFCWRKNASNLKKGLVIIMQITKDSIIGDVLDMDAGCAPMFLEMGMHCLGCPSARGESIAEACEVHGADPDKLVKKLREYFGQE